MENFQEAATALSLDPGGRRRDEASITMAVSVYGGRLFSLTH